MNNFLAFCFLVSAGILAGCHPQEKVVRPAIPVVTADAEAELVPNKIHFVGYLSSNYDAVIQPRVNGYLVSMHYDNGMPVKQGQLLYTIDPGPLSTTLLAAEAELESARAQAVEARNNYDRAIPLAAINAISQAQLDQYTAQHKAADAAVRSAEQALRSAGLNVGYTKIHAPIDGIIAVSSVHPGDFVGPGTQFSVLNTVSSIDTLQVELSMPMSQYLRYAGDRSLYDNGGVLSEIRLTLADGLQYPLPGSYGYTRKDITSQAGTIVFVINFPNPQYTLKPGQFVRVDAHIGSALRRVVVPQQSVSQAQGVNSVWVVMPDSTAEFRTVTLGETYGAFWCVDSGLQPGDQVVVEGRQKLHGRMKVSPVKKL